MRKEAYMAKTAHEFGFMPRVYGRQCCIGFVKGQEDFEEAEPFCT